MSIVFNWLMNQMLKISINSLIRVLNDSDLGSQNNRKSYGIIIFEKFK